MQANYNTFSQLYSAIPLRKKLATDFMAGDRFNSSFICSSFLRSTANEGLDLVGLNVVYPSQSQWRAGEDHPTALATMSMRMPTLYRCITLWRAEIARAQGSRSGATVHWVYATIIMMLKAAKGDELPHVYVNYYAPAQEALSDDAV